MATEHTDKNELTITRTFDAPPAVVYRAWLDEEAYKAWFGPEHFTTPMARIDARVGGRTWFDMRSPQGQDFYGIAEYRELDAPRRIVYGDSFADAEGNSVPGAHYGMPDYPDATTVTVTFEDIGNGQTRMTLRHEGIPAVYREATRQGWDQSFDKLAQLVRELKQEPARG